MNHVLLTGATGMLGTAVIAECIRNGISVTAISRPASRRLNRIPKSDKVTVIECGLEGFDKLPSLAPGKYDVFYHLGWHGTGHDERNNPAIQELNIKYTLDAVNAAAKLGCKVFVGAGSQAEYGRYDKPISENFDAKPETAYGSAKLAACYASAELCANLKIRHVWTRIFSVYGPNDSPKTMISYCIDKLLKGAKPSFTECEQIWDYLYCSDAANAIILAAEKGKDRAVYNIGSGMARPLMEFVWKIRDIINPDLIVGIGEKEYSPGQVMNLAADITRLKKDTGFNPLVTFEEGIREIITWHKENSL
jgi:UDP-glucose 4-epimerase